LNILIGFCSEAQQWQKLFLAEISITIQKIFSGVVSANGCCWFADYLLQRFLSINLVSDIACSTLCEALAKMFI
jgi:hypothetical protein